MRLLLGAILGAAILYSGYWYFGARNAENAMRNWLDDRDSAGWVANYSIVETRGFPNRFDTTISDLELADPATGLAWAAPFFQLFRLSYQPGHYIAIWPGSQTLATPLQKISIATTGAHASLVTRPRDGLALDRATLDFTDISLSSTAEWSVTLDKALLSTRLSATNSYDINLNATALRPQGGTLAMMAESGLVPGVIDSLVLDANLTFDAPWDRHALESRRPQVTAIDLRLMQANWGQLDLWAAGQLSVDDQGRASGEITLKAKNWREMLDLAKQAGWVPEPLVPSIESGLNLVAGMSGSPKTLDAPLTFKDGAVSFGPFRIGTAPKLVLR